MLVLDLLRHMSDAQYDCMTAAYSIGYRLSEKDIQHPHITAAYDERTSGVTVSFNSVLSNDGIWPFVSEDAATCINPVNWHTDDTPAAFTFHGQKLEVKADTVTHMLIVSSDNDAVYRKWNGNSVFKAAGIPPDCLHHYDLLFYTDFIHDNIGSRH